MKNRMSEAEPTAGGGARDFIRDVVKGDLDAGRTKSVVTRFPPEPNGYLHIGHAKSICLNFGLAERYGGRCHMRFDDTNPAKEEEEYVDSILEDVRWLGWDWGEHLYFASDHFDKLHEFAVDLVRKGKAYVDELATMVSPRSVQVMKRQVYGAQFQTLAQAVADANVEMVESFKSEDFKEGVAHYLEKRAPNFSGR